MREERAAEIAENGTVDDAGHLRALGDLYSRNVNLQTVAVGVVDRGAVNDAIELGPESVGHAHRAWLTCGVHSVSRKRRLPEFLACKAHGADFGVGTGIAFAKDRVGCAHQGFAGLGVDDQRAERNRVRRIHGAGCEGVEVAHALFVARSHTNAWFYRGWHGAI